MLVAVLTLALAGLPYAQTGGPDLGRLEREARSSDDTRRVRAWEELLASGDRGRQVLQRAIRHRDRQIRERLTRIMGSAGFQSRKAELARHLDALRKQALTYILNPAMFRKGFGIKGMEERVNKIKALWKEPEQFFAATITTLAAIPHDADEVAHYASRAGVEETFSKGALATLRKAIGIRSMAISDGQHRWNRAVLEWNRKECPTSANSEEELVVLLTNEYRIMMGRRALELDERILRAARAHSQEMEDMGYFSHTSPVKAHAGFGMRLQQKGYSGGMNENIAIAGNATRAFDGWFFSAGHHRNMLAAAGTAIGVGRSKGGKGQYRWTMNLGRGDTLRGRKLTDPSLLYLARRRQLLDGTAESHLALARWCRDRMLIKEMCAQCREALKKNPRLREARQLLAERFKLRKGKK